MQEVGEAFFPGAFAGDPGGEGGFGEGGRGGGEEAGEECHLFGERGRPGGFFAGGGDWGFGGCGRRGFWLFLGVDRNQCGLRFLEGRAQPADVAGGFFAGAFGVEGDQAFEQGFGEGRIRHPGPGRGPGRGVLDSGLRRNDGNQVALAVGGKDGGVEFVVEGLQDADQALFTEGFVLGSQGFAGTELGEDVVEAGQGQRRVLCLLALAVGVELFGEVADAGLLVGRGVREGEGFESGGFDVNRSIFKCAARRQNPRDVDGAGQDAQRISVVEGDANEFVVWRDGGVEELESAVLGGFDGGDVTRQAGKLNAQLRVGFAKKPPVFAPALTLVGVALRLHPFINPLVSCRVTAAHVCCGQPE